MHWRSLDSILLECIRHKWGTYTCLFSKMVSVDWQSNVRAVHVCLPLHSHSCWGNIPDCLPVVSACTRFRRNIDEAIDPDSHCDCKVKTPDAFASFSARSLSLVSPCLRRKPHICCSSWLGLPLIARARSTHKHTNAHPHLCRCCGCLLRQKKQRMNAVYD